MIATVPQEILAPVQEENSKPFTLEDFVANPLQDMEWVDGELVERTGMTVKHGIGSSCSVLGELCSIK